MEQDTIDMFNNKIVIEYFLLKKNVLTENKLTEIQENIKYIMSSDVILFSCDPASYEFMLKCFKQGQKTEYFYFNFYKNKQNLLTYVVIYYHVLMIQKLQEQMKALNKKYQTMTVNQFPKKAYKQY